MWEREEREILQNWRSTVGISSLYVCLLWAMAAGHTYLMTWLSFLHEVPFFLSSSYHFTSSLYSLLAFNSQTYLYIDDPCPDHTHWRKMIHDQDYCLGSNSQSHHHQYQNCLNIQHHCLTTLKGHNSYISSLTLAGKFLYTGSSDNEIRSWDRSTFNAELSSEEGVENVVAIGKGAVKSLVVLSDRLFSAHQDQKIRVWRISTDVPQHQRYTKIATLPTLGDRAMKILIPKNQVQIRRHKKCTWVHHVDAVSALALSSDEFLLYSVSWDRTLKIWRTSDFKCLESVPNAHDDAINAMVASTDGSIYTGSADKRIKVWKKLQGERAHTRVDLLENHSSGVNALALNTASTVLYSGSCDSAIFVWEKDQSDKMAVVGVLQGHSQSILCLAVMSDLLFSGSADKTIRIWSSVDRNHSCLAVLEGHQGPVKCLAATLDQYNPPDTFLIYSGSLDCSIKVWRIFITRD